MHPHEMTIGAGMGGEIKLARIEGRADPCQLSEYAQPIAWMHGKQVAFDIELTFAGRRQPFDAVAYAGNPYPNARAIAAGDGTQRRRRRRGHLLRQLPGNCLDAYWREV